MKNRCANGTGLGAPPTPLVWAGFGSGFPDFPSILNFRTTYQSSFIFYEWGDYWVLLQIN